MHLRFGVFGQQATAVFAGLVLEPVGDWSPWLLVDLGSNMFVGQ